MFVLKQLSKDNLLRSANVRSHYRFKFPEWIWNRMDDYKSVLTICHHWSLSVLHTGAAGGGGE